MNNPINEIKTKLAMSEEQKAVAKTLAKAVATQIVIGAVVSLGTAALVKGVTVISESATDLVKDMFPLNGDKAMIDLNDQS